MRKKLSFLSVSAMAAALAFTAPATLQAQTPGLGTTTSSPSLAASYNTAITSDRAVAIVVNNDGDPSPNEFLYFKIQGRGVPFVSHSWYSNPTAWMTDSDFHFKNLNLRMWNNKVAFGNYIGKKVVLYGPDANADHQYFGFGIDPSTLRYQVNDVGSDHVFYAGTGPSTSKELLRVRGNGVAGIPKSGSLEFGYGLAGKQSDAGRICYQVWSDGLEIIGAGTNGSDRKITLYGEGGTRTTGTLSVGVDRNFNPPATLTDGNISLSSYKLFVNGGILAKECRVRASWADYVFAPGYHLAPLSEVEERINEEGHLPGMPSAAEVAANGLPLGEIAKMQQEKIEELTLYIIQLDKEVKALKSASAHQ